MEREGGHGPRNYMTVSTSPPTLRRVTPELAER